MKRIATAFAAATLLALSGCGSDDTGDQAADAPASTTQATEEATPSPKQTPTDPATIVANLTATGLPITDSVVVTEDNDPNSLIGRPGQYVSKVVFADERTGVTLDPVALSNDAGGSVEVFTDAATAQARSDYIQKTLASLGPVAGTEYHYLTGTALVRVAGALPPSAAADYQAAVEAIN